ncbi:hypothetical protein [Cytophaga aurantiaca]|uniref:hypothetical protein n=1 Tax=Cytophaga aurantiaca TaxID=29530 RepID=UPI000367EDBA|nr:hypothetical protein [Cytophaga aurantiaca]
MKFLYFFLSLFITSLASAQTIHVKIYDGTTEQPIKSVKVKSLHDHDLITFSNDSGYFAFNLKHNDTILLEKDYYYPVFMSLTTHNFDSTHVIKLQLFPSAKVYKVPTQYSKMNLQSFEYHFTHDEIGTDSKAKITVMQTGDAVKAQQVYTGKPLKIISIDAFPNTGAKHKNHYILAQPDTY